MTHARLIIGDTRAGCASLPDASVDLVMTSPPFLALRNYLPADHPDKALEIGSEASPAAYLDVLLGLAAEWRRVLAPHGSICVELGDTYAGGGPAASADVAPVTKSVRSKLDGWPLEKSLVGIPHLFHLSLAYGRNLLTGEESPAGMWRVRNVVAWCRPNPVPGALGDKFRPAMSFLTVACTAKDRWFDLEPLRTPHMEPIRENINRPKRQAEGDARVATGGDSRGFVLRSGHPGGAPPLDYWEIPVEPYKGAHFATYPEELCRRPIEAMCPRQVCTACGRPRRRIMEVEHEATRATNGPRSADRRWMDGGTAGFAVRAERVAHTVGWSDCGCGAEFRRGLVLDPFAGSGTTLAVAVGLGRDALGFDLDARNAELAAERCGMFLTVEKLASAEEAAG